MGLTTVAELTLPRFAHPCDSVLSTAVQMCAKVSILGGKELYLGQEGGDIQVVDGHVPGAVGVCNQSYLCPLGKGGAPDEPLAFGVLADAAHPRSGGVCCSFVCPGKGVQLAEVCQAGLQVL